MARYTQAARGRFDCYLMRDGIPVAYTDYDVVKLTGYYRDSDRAAVADFGAEYEMPVEWDKVHVAGFGLLS